MWDLQNERQTHMRRARRLHHLLTHLVLPSLNLGEVKQNTVTIPIMLVTFYLLVALIAKERPTCSAGHLVAAFTSLNGHATGRTLLASFLQQRAHMYHHMIICVARPHSKL